MEYRVDSRDIKFQVFEWLKLGELLEADKFADWDAENAQTIMEQILVGAGNEVEAGHGGLLVIGKPLPYMLRTVWNDPDRYIETYFSRWKGVWYHGDWAYVDEDGFWFLHGRSDDTVNVAGKRVGPAEVEAALVRAAGK